MHDFAIFLSELVTPLLVKEEKYRPKDTPRPGLTRHGHSQPALAALANFLDALPIAFHTLWRPKSHMPKNGWGPQVG